MALTPTEREEHFFKAMVDAADGSTPEELEPTERKEHWYKEIIDAIKAGGGGSGGGVLLVHAEGGTLDKTWQEIANAVASTGAVIVLENEGAVISADVITSAYKDGEEAYTVNVNGVSYDTSSASGYPSTGK